MKLNVTHCLQANLAIQIGLGVFESFPIFPLIAINVIHQWANLCILQMFPFFVLTSPSFIISLGNVSFKEVESFILVFLF